MSKAGVDWFKFRTQSAPLTVFEAIRPAFAGGEDLELEPEMPGKDGWKSDEAFACMVMWWLGWTTAVILNGVGFVLKCRGRGVVGFVIGALWRPLWVVCSVQS